MTESRSVYHLMLAFYGAKLFTVYPELSRLENSFEETKRDLQMMA